MGRHNSYPRAKRYKRGQDVTGAFELLALSAACFDQPPQIAQDDLITGLAQAEEKGQQLSEDELVATIFLLLGAGYETTVNLIGTGR